MKIFRFTLLLVSVGIFPIHASIYDLTKTLLGITPTFDKKLSKFSAKDFAKGKAFAHGLDAKFVEINPALTQISHFLTKPMLLYVLHHNEIINDAVFNSDGKYIATASSDKTAKLFDAETGKEIFTLTTPGIGRVKSVTFDLDNETLVTNPYNGTSRIRYPSMDHTVRLWNVAIGKLEKEIPWKDGKVLAVAFIPFLYFLTTPDDLLVEVWNMTTQEKIASLMGHTDIVTCAAFSPDGSRIITTSADKTAYIWQTAKGKLITALSGHKDQINSGTFSADGKFVVTASADHTTRIWHSLTGEPTGAAPLKHDEAITSAQFSPDGTKIITSSTDKTARLWNAATGEYIATLNGHKGAVLNARFSPDNTKVVTASIDGTARVWHIPTDEERAYANFTAGTLSLKQILFLILLQTYATSPETTTATSTVPTKVKMSHEPEVIIATPKTVSLRAIAEHRPEVTVEELRAILNEPSIPGAEKTGFSPAFRALIIKHFGIADTQPSDEGSTALPQKDTAAETPSRRPSR